MTLEEGSLMCDQFPDKKILSITEPYPCSWLILFKMPHIDSVRTRNAADSYILRQPCAIATSRDKIGCQILSISQNAVTPVHQYGRHIQVLVAVTLSFAISVLLLIAVVVLVSSITHNAMSLKSSLHSFIFQTCSRSYIVTEVPCWRTVTGLPTADGYDTSAVLLTVGRYAKGGYLTCLHALIIFFRCSWSVVGFVDGCSEALVAAPPPDYTGSRPVEGEVPIEGYLGNSRLEALERAGLL